jgi:uncharacterized protein YggT (Ycf19 family)
MAIIHQTEEIYDAGETTTVNWLAQIIYYFAGAINVILLLRLLFRVFGANPASGIVQLIYGLSNVFLVPFRGIFPAAGAGEFVLEPSVIVAILIYSLLAKGLVELLYVLNKR